jgi:F0F1-type ATP synthase delta subunit
MLSLHVLANILMSLSRTIAEYLETSNATSQDVEDVLIKYNLRALLPEILRVLVRKENMRAEKDMVAIESPFPLSEDSITAIKKIANGEDKEHSIKINPNLLAGFKAKYKDTMYDASAERIINQFEGAQ